MTEKAPKTDFRSLFDRDYIAAFDLNGKDVTVTIAKVEGKQLTSAGGKTNKKPVLHFDGAEKGFVCNKTNSRVIATLYGNFTEDWVGKKLTMYPTKTHSPAGETDCIRIRPSIPGKA